MNCGACGARPLPNAIFCVQCGARVVPQWDEDSDELTVTVRRLTLQNAVEPLSPPPRADQVPGGPPPIRQRPDESDTAEIAVDAIALVSNWYVLLPDGVRIDAVLPLILGRRPTHGAGPNGAQLVTVPDPEGTVSRSHALIEPIAGALRVTNVSAKNTIPVAWPDGVRYNILPGEHLVIANMCVAKLGRVPLLLQRA